MEKKMIREMVFAKHYEGDQATVTFSDFPPNILPTDEVDIMRDKGYYSENNSWDAFTELQVYRERIETDEEFEKRKMDTERTRKQMRELRYNSYLKLKEEFENEKNT